MREPATARSVGLNSGYVCPLSRMASCQRWETQRKVDRHPAEVAAPMASQLHAPGGEVRRTPLGGQNNPF